MLFDSIVVHDQVLAVPPTTFYTVWSLGHECPLLDGLPCQSAQLTTKQKSAEAYFVNMSPNSCQKCT